MSSPKKDGHSRPRGCLLFSVSTMITAIIIGVFLNRGSVPEIKVKKDFGFKELSPGENPVVDIIAIHGLDGHRETSWTADNGVMWLRDLLPQDLPNARILAYGYEADTRSFTQTSTQNIFHHAEELVTRLSQFRDGNSQRPIIFLAHSLGGIILKEALALCNAASYNHRSQRRDIKASTSAILFFGTPHSGANGVQLAEWMTTLFSVYMSTSETLLKDLKRDSPELEKIQYRYLEASEELRSIFLYEVHRTPIFGGHSKLIVPRHLATIAGERSADVVAIHADHVQMVKFRERDDSDYETVARYLVQLTKEATGKVEKNWARERSHRTIESGESHQDLLLYIPKPLPPVSKYYVERPRIQDILTEKLLPPGLPQRQRFCVLHGLAGSGKTQLAVSWVNKNKERLGRVIYIDASSEDHIRADLETAIRSQGPEYREATWNQAVSHLSTERDWMILFDNADTPDLPFGEYTPNTEHGVVLITTRNRYYSSYAPDCHISAELLEEPEALDILHSVAMNSPSSNDTSLAIVNELGLLALPITQAGAYIFKTRRFDTYLEIFRKHREKLMQEASLKDRNYEGSTYSAFEMSFNLLPETSQEFMKICAFLHYALTPQALFEMSTSSRFQRVLVLPDYPPLPETEAIVSNLTKLFGSEWDEFKFQALIDPVIQGSLMDVVIDSSNRIFYSFHPLVQTYIREQQTKYHEDLYGLSVGHLLLSAISSFGGENCNWFRQLVPHIDIFLMRIRQAHATHLCAFADVYRAVGNSNSSQPLNESCYYQLNAVLGPRHPTTITSIHNLAIILYDIGQFQDAEKMQQVVLTLRKEVLGLRDPDTLTSMSNLAATLQELGQFQDAEKMQREALMLRKEVLGPQHPATLNSMNNLASTLHSLGQIHDAEKMQREALMLRKEVLGPQHPDTIDSINNLAITLHGLGQIHDAEKMQREVLMLRKEVLGPHHPNTITSMSNLAVTLQELGQFQDAEKMQQEALTLRKEALGPWHLDTISSMHHLAFTLHRLGQFQGAEKMHQEALTLRKELLGLRHPDTISSMHNLAGTLQELGQLQAAKKMQQEVLMLRKEVLGPRHRHTIASMSNLAITLHKISQFQDAKKMWQEVLTLRKEILGVWHLDTIVSMNNLASTLQSLGQFQDAKKIQQEALTLRKEVLGPWHPDTIDSMSSLAFTLQRLGQFQDAEKMQQEVLTLQKEVLGPQHLDTINSMSGLAFTLYELGQLQDAEKLQREVLTLRKEVLGPRHPDTIDSMHNLVNILYGLDQLQDAEKMQQEALTLSKEVLGLQHPETIRSMHNLAGIRYVLGQSQDAKKKKQKPLTFQTVAS